jgi:hypothetical protein
VLHADTHTIECGYRSEYLPKYGAQEVGEHRYDEMVDAELAKARTQLAAALTHCTNVSSIEVWDEEKSWVEIIIHLAR